ncbi:MAG: hypothetical protein ACI4SO_08010 [Muribaculaceae bacterium]
MNFIISLATVMVVFVTMLLLQHIVYKREKSLLDINNAYKNAFHSLFKDKVEYARLVVQLNEEKQAYKKAIDDCIENFNAVYANTKLSFDEDKCAFVIEDIPVGDTTTTKEEINAQNENKDENQ